MPLFGRHPGGTRGPADGDRFEALLAAGIELARETFAAFGAEHGLAPAAIDRVITHQVGSAHRRLLLEALELGEGRDFPTFPVLGNVGTVSLPISLGMAAEQGFVGEGQRVALLGIGSGLACQMLDVRW
ncbi:MAG: 3-oxoacyl-[acyl-carrier-protein] synthase III C-terminal domain-containing protein [Planctomycetota bacterium]